MKKLSRSLGAMCFTTALMVQAQSSPSLPHLQRNGAATQLMVDGKPMILLAGELHNSSPSSPAYMRPIWDKLQAMHLNAAIGTASWELVEPEEGHFDFAAVDDEVQQAKAHNMRLVLIWFGSFKNASYTYTPIWVKRDTQRFPLAQLQTKDGHLRPGNTLSAFGTESMKADARAFAALMKHLRDTDHSHTVVMIQVENETGIRNDDDARDRSPLAKAAYYSQVPSELLAWMKSHSNTMLPELKAVWAEAGSHTSGTWSQVFGTSAFGDEVFMAWYTARYVQTVAEAGARELPLPMYANAWLVQFPEETPGRYPSGGPVSRVMDIWKVAAPTLALLAPDIYLADYEGVCASYTRDGNPLFVPEARPSVSKLFVSIAKYGAIGYSPFGIDSIDDDLLGSAYETLGGLMKPLTVAQAKGNIQLIPAAAGGDLDLPFGDVTLHIERGVRGNPPKPSNIEKEATGDLPPAPGEAVHSFNNAGTETAKPASPQQTNTFLHPFTDGRIATGMIVPDGPDSFYVVGDALALTFSSRQTGRQTRIGMVDEVRVEDGKGVAGRRLNGDETFGANRVILGPNEVTAMHITLYSVPQ